MAGRITIGCTLVLWLLLQAACTATRSSRMVVYTEDSKTVYSEYFELDQRVLDGRLRVHFLVTLGDERLPEGTRFPPGLFVDSDGNISKRGRADGWVEEVHEIYFTNLGDSPITLSDLELKIPDLRPIRSDPLSPDPVTIEVGSFVKTEPLIYLGTVYRQSFQQVEIHFTHAGEPQIVQGPARRLRIDELEQ